jgi:cytochrome c-type biogenesis protein
MRFHLLGEDMDGPITIAVAFGAGLLSFLSPCVLPVVPGYLGFITGMSFDELRDGTDRSAVVVPALFFIAGFTTIFILMGATATLLGEALLRYKEPISRIGGIVIIVFGLHLLGVFRLTPLLRERRFHLAHSTAGHAGAFFTGLAFGAGWTPCLGPVLSALLTYAGVRETMTGGMFLLSAYALGLAVPFLLAALATTWFLHASRRIQHLVPVFEKISGAVLILMGLLLLTGSFTMLSGYFLRWTPDALLDRL